MANFMMLKEIIRHLYEVSEVSGRKVLKTKTLIKIIFPHTQS